MPQAMREQVRRLGCMPSHIPRIFTSRQPGAQRMSPPQRDPAGLWRFRAIGRSRPFRRGRRFQRRLPGRCVASARHVLPAAATTTEAGIGMRVDPDWLAYPPTRPASHIPALNHAQRSCIPPPRPATARAPSPETCAFRPQGHVVGRFSGPARAGPISSS